MMTESSDKVNTVSVCILTISDSCSAGKAEDTSGPLLAQLVKEDPKLNGVVVDTACVPDEVQDIRKMLVTWADTKKADIILTTGGTGFAARDVTPEATLSVLDKQAPGLVVAMLSGSLAVTPLAALSRPAAGVRGTCVIVNMPGSKKAVKECYSFVQPSLRHAVDLLQDRKGLFCSRKPDKATDASPQTTYHVHECPHQSGGKGDKDAGDGTVAGRARQSQWPMISVEEAQATIFSECRKLLHTESGVSVLSVEEVDFFDSIGRVLFQDVIAQDPLPPFPASTKDGYAVIASDGPGVRQVRGEASAGCDPGMAPLSPGQVIRINTGAPIPPGADAVVMVENTKLVKKSPDGQEELEVEILTKVTPGQDIRPVGCDIKTGEKVLSGGQVLGSGELGVMAAVGVTKVNVSKLPVVTVLSTGNEIQPPGQRLLPGHVRDSNKTTLMSLLSSSGVKPRDGGIARDEITILTNSLHEALKSSEIVVTTGGVSMGDRDLLRQVLVDNFGAKIHFARVNMKPGKPTTFATCTYLGRTRLVIGLPGNPVSASVTCLLYVLPAVRMLSGEKSPLPGTLRAKLSCEKPIRLDLRPEYVRVHLSFQPGEAVGDARVTGDQMSSRQSSMTQANGLMLLPGRTESLSQVENGFVTDVILIGSLMMKSL